MHHRILRQILPPFLFDALGKTAISMGIIKQYIYQPAWHKIKNGMLRGREIYVDPHDGYWQKEMVSGFFDEFFIHYLNGLNIKGGAVYEIGAHIGYHAMNFAELIGTTGEVFAFEPNPFNIERMEIILSRNIDLKERIKIIPYALSEKNGETIFNFSTQIDNGTSSGSYLNGAHTPFRERDYEKIGFKKMHVKTFSLDKLITESKLREPSLLKIDVEGAEHLVLNGALNTIRKTKPIVLMEVHSIYNMFHAFNFFISNNYSVTLLNTSSDGRCFISASPN